MQMIEPGTTMEIVWSAYRSVLSRLGRGSLAYVSAPITSGKLALDGLPRGEVIRRNIETGTALAEEIARGLFVPVVAPMIFDARAHGWTQQSYMTMWLAMIEENVGSIYMTPDWEYSSGCAEEYLRAVNMAHGFGSRWTIWPRRSGGAVVHLHEGLEALVAALHAFQDRGVRAETTASVILGLYAAWRAWHCPDVSADLPKDYNREVVGGVNSDRVLAAIRAAAPILRCVYGWTGELTLSLADGAVRKINAWPEGVVIGEVGD